MGNALSGAGKWPIFAWACDKPLGVEEPCRVDDFTAGFSVFGFTERSTFVDVFHCLMEGDDGVQECFLCLSICPRIDEVVGQYEPVHVPISMNYWPGAVVDIVIVR